MIKENIGFVFALVLIFIGGMLIRAGMENKNPTKEQIQKEVQIHMDVLRKDWEERYQLAVAEMRTKWEMRMGNSKIMSVRIEELNGDKVEYKLELTNTEDRLDWIPPFQWQSKHEIHEPEKGSNKETTCRSEK